MCRFGTGVDVSEDISTKKKRVNFLKTIGQGLKSCYSIDLDLTALSSADGAAVPELLKLAHMLQSARKVHTAFLINEQIRALFQYSVTPSSFDLQVGEKLRVAINH
jgi:ABC-type transporter Mla MlaB component